jgi:beta-1,4-mannosyl-glycoprotein beta-1,4-N-acetylglucosaminyltransferase
MIVDAFTFYKEFDLLDCRLKYLSPYVDYFVICECNLSQSGLPKPYYFKENMDRYQEYMHKIVYVPMFLDETQQYSPWFIEMYQRNFLAAAMHRFPNDATVIITDSDEIINPAVLPAVTEALKHKTIVRLAFDIQYYNLAYKIPDITWWHPGAGKARDIFRYFPSAFRTFLSDIMPNDREWIFSAGWHLSYFLDADQIVNKLKNFAHREFDGMERSIILDKIDQKVTLNSEFSAENLALQHLSPEYYPPDFLAAFGQYYPKINS